MNFDTKQPHGAAEKRASLGSGLRSIKVRNFTEQVDDTSKYL